MAETTSWRYEEDETERNGTERDGTLEDINNGEKYDLFPSALPCNNNEEQASYIVLLL